MTQTTREGRGAGRRDSASMPTREALLTVAERLFLADGYDKVSVRAICAAAETNPAAVHYHFGTKEDLTIALLQSRLGPLWADPLASLDPAVTSIAQVVDVVVDPFVDLQADPAGHLHLRLLARFVFAHPTAGWTSRWFDLDPFADMLADAVPGLTAGQARRRWALAFQLILLRFGGTETLSTAAVTALTGFVTAGLTAPAP
ncbi:TetR/AcrR family transcriptional regulator [Gordonia sp. KTR9]|uniref:TetR/AcrR family transcriptional regulator n=1 Tax=Gordonia sp. KTR9 TaxID=337191 RepID=UPI00027DD784|nr:TetR/AcrR family transcriptional regulator [Gordonia sp. KTR9]AFR47304.1 Transcriptional regulator [Gordonia sp. KTR9]